MKKHLTTKNHFTIKKHFTIKISWDILIKANPINCLKSYFISLKKLLISIKFTNKQL